MATVQELVSQQAELEKQAAALQEQIEQARKAERAEGLARIKALMADYGVTLAELGGGGKGGGRAAKSAKPSASAGKKVPPKYRDAASGNTWSGRGLQPNWLKAALAGGRKLEDFAV
jgi:DNA-binding protein H-NS